MKSMMLEFSHPIDIASVKNEGITYHIEATKAECQALADRFELVAVQSLAATLTVAPWEGTSIIRVEGVFDAHVVQMCVVTLEPISQRVRDHFIDFFSSADTFPHKENISVLEEPPPELLSKDNMIDLGEVIAQYLCLVLDPYPCKHEEIRSGSVSDSVLDDRKDRVAKMNPFTGLKARKTCLT